MNVFNNNVTISGAKLHIFNETRNEITNYFQRKPFCCFFEEMFGRLRIKA